MIIELLESKLRLKEAIESLLNVEIDEYQTVIIKKFVLDNIKEESEIKLKHKN